MTACVSKTPYFLKNPYIPPLSPEHVDKIFSNHIQESTSLPFSICVYLKELAFCHYQLLRVEGKQLHYELDPKDLTMYFLGEQAPLSLIIASFFIADRKFFQIAESLCLPPDCDDFLHYNGILMNRAHEGAHLIDPEDESTVLRVFTYVCDRPFFPKQDYFLAGCDTSKLLYQKTIDEIDKLLDFDIGPKLS